MSVTPGAVDSLQAVFPVAAVVVRCFSLQQLCICSAERCKHRGACYRGGFDRNCEIDTDHPMSILIRWLLGPHGDRLYGSPVSAWSRFPECGA